eukprot:Nitzschia sp. Nitz4//scaffold438_size7339//4319//5842//NITZ4_009159-RA/size7339-processed-gene-0.2-mRNA-1//-1//CDS//3329551859//9449//frame0
MFKLSLMAVAALLVTLLVAHNPLVVSAKEIEATKEWQLVREGDTIPAGLHVRIDMTTGEKWVKLVDENEELNENHLAAAVVQPDGALEPMDIDDDDDEADEPKDSDFDYEMMHRTLSKLPDEEKERMGLPELPPPAATRLTSVERQEFEKRMAEIWKARQAELKVVQEMLMDVPEVLKQRIISIREYIYSPEEQLQQLDLENINMMEEGVVDNIVEVLQDLEFQLADVDNARDFHTMGGWDLLVSLLTEEVHMRNLTTTSNISQETLQKIRTVQAQAAWVMGTAVKNTGEFFPYAIEKIDIGVRKAAALDLLMDLFCRQYENTNTASVDNLLQAKAIYAIGAMLRGNRLSQSYLTGKDWGVQLSTKLQHLMKDMSRSNLKLMQRLLSLASDLIMDCTIHGEEAYAEAQWVIVEMFTSPEWCDSASVILQTDAATLPLQFQEAMLHAVETMSPHCKLWKDRSSSHHQALQSLQRGWEQSGSLDPEHLQSLAMLVDRINDTILNATHAT